MCLHRRTMEGRRGGWGVNLGPRLSNTPHPIADGDSKNAYVKPTTVSPPVYMARDRECNQMLSRSCHWDPYLYRSLQVLLPVPPGHISSRVGRWWWEPSLLSVAFSRMGYFSEESIVGSVSSTNRGGGITYNPLTRRCDPSSNNVIRDDARRGVEPKPVVITAL